MTVHEMLMREFPVRKSEMQKEEFRKWATARLTAAGLDVRTETAYGGNNNLIAGEPERAKIIFTAHYDTPANMLFPNIMIPVNVIVRLCYLLLSICALLIPSVGLGLLAKMLTGSEPVGLMCYVILYFGMLYLMMRGPANKNNANDNTSGVAAVIALAESLPAEMRSKCAFILFDNEEKGLKGSKAYAKAHPQVRDEKLTVNMDCVGNGEHFIVIAKSAVRACPEFHALKAALEGIRTHGAYFPERGTANSDQKSFKRGIAVLACSKYPVIGYATGRIHTKKDTLCSMENIDALVKAFTEWIKDI